MKHARPALLVTLIAALGLSLALPAAYCATNVFDLPALHTHHLQLLAVMEASYGQKDFSAMEQACRQGLKCGSADELWAYNLACACALQGKTKDAFTALNQAIDAGFLDTDHLAQDPDLASLRGSPDFTTCLSRMRQLLQAAAPRAHRLAAAKPDVAGAVMQSASNTLWSFQMGVFHALMDLPVTDSRPPIAGPEAPTVNAWLKEGSATGYAGLLYVNRDGDSQPLDTSLFPGLSRLRYAPEMTDRKLDIGLPNTLFVSDADGLLIPVLGNSSLGYLSTAYWRSQPRAVCGDPRQANLQSIFLFGNQLFFYPAYGDYDLRTGDLFPANNPCFIAVAGQNNAERPFLEAAASALAAMRPETRAALTRSALLMPTLNMLFRASQKTLSSRQAYLTGIAHPPAFLPAHLDAPKLVRMAHEITTNDLPPVVLLNVLSETRMIPDRDFFDIVRSENLFDAPLAVARVFRGVARTRTLQLRASCKRPEARLHWVVLQGDPSKVLFTPCPTNAALMTVTVAHHTPFETPIGNNQRIWTSRLDIGVIAETASTFSLPAIVSVYFLGNEQRTYGEGGRIISVDYTRPNPGYNDPLLSLERNWKDVFEYDAHGNMTGWRRIRGLEQERFTAFGHRVVASDQQGRATRAHIIRYLPRRIRSEDTQEGIPDLAQIDDNQAVAYRYASDSDFVGQPEPSTLTTDVQQLTPELTVSP